MKKARPRMSAMARMALTALREAVAQVVEEHQREGRPLAVWRNGKAVLVSPGKPAVVRETSANYRASKKGRTRTHP